MTEAKFKVGDHVIYQESRYWIIKPAKLVDGVWFYEIRLDEGGENDGFTPLPVKESELKKA